MFQKGKKNPHSGGLNIMIVGCGKVGKTLVERLSKEGHGHFSLWTRVRRVCRVLQICMMYLVSLEMAQVLPY